MKLTSVFLSLREGFRNLVRHPLVMLASISTIALMLILLGFFTVFSLNARHIMTVAGQQPPIEITMRNGVGDKELADLDRYLANDDDVLEFQRYSPQENFNQFVDNMENSELLTPRWRNPSKPEWPAWRACAKFLLNWRSCLS
jgi:cell division transport system permease protein